MIVEAPRIRVVVILGHAIAAGAAVVIEVHNDWLASVFRFLTLRKPNTTMPCNSDYMNPTHHEVESKLACEFLAYALPALGKPVPEWVATAAREYYGNPKRLNDATVMLCTLCRAMTEAQKSAVIYDGRNAKARALAGWWEEHQKADVEREARETEAKEREKTKLGAFAKLTPKERKALLG